MLWMSPVVTNNQKSNTVVGNEPVNNRIREALDQRATDSFHFWVEFWIFDDAIYRSIDFGSERTAQTGPLAVVVIYSLIEIESR